MPHVLFDTAGTFKGVFWLVVARRDCGSIADGLLSMDFICNVYGTCEYVVVLVCNAI